MSRSGYSDELDSNWALIIWRGAVASAIRGKRGQAFLKEMLGAMDAMAEKKLVHGDLETVGGEVCALGSIGKARGIDMAALDPEDSETIAETFGIATAMAREIVYENDEGAGYWKDETPEDRFVRMRAWIAGNIKP